MLPILASFLFDCNQAADVIANVYRNEYLTREDQQGLIEAMLEVTPPGCEAHFYNETDD